MKKIICAIIAMVVLSTNVYGQMSPADLETDAVNNTDLAKEFTQRGSAVLKGGLNQENLYIARYLYTEAGKLYEQAKRIYQTLVKQYYLGPDYVDGTDKAVKSCIDAVKKCNQKLAQLEAVKKSQKRRFKFR